MSLDPSCRKACSNVCVPKCQVTRFASLGIRNRPEAFIASTLGNEVGPMDGTPELGGLVAGGVGLVAGGVGLVAGGVGLVAGGVGLVAGGVGLVAGGVG